MTRGEYFKLVLECFTKEKDRNSFNFWNEPDGLWKERWIVLFQEKGGKRRSFGFSEGLLKLEEEADLNKELADFKNKYPEHYEIFVNWLRKRKLSQCCFN
jgi:hypothetical protein